MGLLSLIQCTVGSVGILAAVATYIWFRRPAIAVKLMFKTVFYMSGLRPHYVKAGKYVYCYGERGAPRDDRSSLLLVHGFSSSKDQWVQIVQNLPKNLHIVVVDLPGHGDTTIPDPDDDVRVRKLVISLNEFVRAIGLDRRPFHLVGTSMGGAICGCYAADYPTHVNRLTAICPALRSPVKTDFLKEAEAGHCRLIPETADELKAMLNSTVYHPIEASHQFFEGAIQLRRPKSRFYHQLFGALMKDDEGEEEALRKLTLLKLPVQVIWGQHDQLIHVSGIDVLKERVPHIESIEVFERCGHSVAIDRPGQLTKSLLLFRGEYRKKST